MAAGSFSSTVSLWNYGNLHKSFDNYLSNRFQGVTIPGRCSEWVEIKAGVPKVPF